MATETRVPALPVHCLCGAMFSCFDRTQAYDGQTDASRIMYTALARRRTVKMGTIDMFPYNAGAYVAVSREKVGTMNGDSISLALFD